MAVQVRMPKPPEPPQPSGGGGLGKWGGLLGAVAGAGALASIPLTGGASAPGVAAYLGAAGAGGALGGMVGGALDPVRPGGPAEAQKEGVYGDPGAMDRRLQELKSSPQEQLRESINSLKFIPDDQLRAQIAQPLLLAQQEAKRLGQA